MKNKEEKGTWNILLFLYCFDRVRLNVEECKRVKNVDKISQFYFLNNSNFSSPSFPYNELTHNKKI